MCSILPSSDIDKTLAQTFKTSATTTGNSKQLFYLFPRHSVDFQYGRVVVKCHNEQQLVQADAGNPFEYYVEFFGQSLRAPRLALYGVRRRSLDPSCSLKLIQKDDTATYPLTATQVESMERLLRESEQVLRRMTNIILKVDPAAREFILDFGALGGLQAPILLPHRSPEFYAGIPRNGTFSVFQGATWCDYDPPIPTRAMYERCIEQIDLHFGQVPRISPRERRAAIREMLTLAALSRNLARGRQ